uniref:WGS project CBMI000000000 data, contig CS3069_c001551 n=1 Tax=Fusarium clavum TaxID=2594811 RepID=A0A090N5I0_9HYPO|nr:unnamed protein product [Fusarium clavum]
MDSIRRTLSKLTLKPSSGSERHRSPSLDEDSLVIFRDSDVEDPVNWPLARKRYISAVAVLISMNGSFASSILTGATESITQEFGVSRVAAGLTTSLFLLGFCAGPLLFGPLSEFYGRRWILYATLFLYLAFTFLTAWPPNFGVLLVGRFIAGSFAAGPGTVVGGILVDLWDKCACGSAMGVFICAGWVGPALGTVISGAVELQKDWHWGMYVCLWYAGFSCLIVFTIPETQRVTILSYKAKMARKEGHDVQAEQEASKPKLTQLYKTALTRPWILLFDVIAFLCCIYSCVIAALQYMLFSIYPLVFQEMRGWNAAVSQLPILGQAIGAILGLLIVLANSKRRKRKVARELEIPPEDHMVLAMIGGVGFPISMLWLSWSAQYK